jgi:hypothetical protein
MADIMLSYESGKTIVAKAYLGITQVGIDMGMIEIPGTGVYVVNIPQSPLLGALPFGTYTIIAIDTALVGVQTVSGGQLQWGGRAEVQLEYCTILGLNAQAPSTTNRLNRTWTAGGITLSLGGDLIDNTVVTRVIL